MEYERLSELVKNYRPNEEVHKALGQIELAGTVGASASGKTSIMESAVKSKFKPPIQIVISDTSRPPRENERNGVEYHFWTKEQMLQGISYGRYVQVAISPGGEIYATRPESYPNNGVGTMAIYSHVLNIFRGLPFRRIYASFIVPSSFDSWQAWLSHQANVSSWTGEQFWTRLREAKQSYEFALADNQIKFILNDRIDSAAARLKQVARGETPDDEPLAKNTAHQNLKLLAKLAESKR